MGGLVETCSKAVIERRANTHVPRKAVPLHPSQLGEVEVSQLRLRVDSSRPRSPFRHSVHSEEDAELCQTKAFVLARQREQERRDAQREYQNTLRIMRSKAVRWPATTSHGGIHSPLSSRRL